MPNLLSSVTCHVSFGDRQREDGSPTKLPMFSKSFRTRTRARTRTRSLTRTRQQSIDRHPRSRAARATQAQKRIATAWQRWLRR